jgi:exodeoxyribonuclease X
MRSIIGDLLKIYMNNESIVFLDTETTDKVEGRLVELAFTSFSKNGTSLMTTLRCKPPLPITNGAKAIHHIRNRDVADCPAFQDHIQYPYIKTKIEEGIVVAHNAPFDIAVLKREGITARRFVDTLKLARFLYPDLENHQLQFLRYELEAEVQTGDNLAAHSADGDVRVLMAVSDRLMEELKKREALDDHTVVDRAVEISMQPLLLPRLTFGKHVGKTFAEVAAHPQDRGWLEWILKQKEENPSDDDVDFLYTVRHHLGRLV